MITGHADRHRVEGARDAGVNEMLVKPVTERGLHSRIQEIILKPRPFISGPELFWTLPAPAPRSELQGRGTAQDRHGDLTPLLAASLRRGDRDRLHSGAKSIREGIMTLRNIRVGFCTRRVTPLVAEAQPATKTFPVVQGKTYKFEKIADGVYYATGGFGSNNVVIVNDDDVLLVDTGTSPANARGVRGGRQDASNKPVRYVVNTHWHYYDPHRRELDLRPGGADHRA